MKIGYFYIKAGNGHYIPAKAMHEKTIEQFGEGSSELVDFYRDAAKDEKLANWTQKMWSRIMLNPNRERFESYLYDNNVLFCKSIYKSFVSRRAKKNFITYMNEHKFDCIVATNCVIACIIAGLVKKCKFNIPVYYYCSDLIFCYKFAAKDKDITGFIAPSEDCVKSLEKNGAKNIIQIPIPVQNQIFASTKVDKATAKEALCIPRNKFSLLYQLGGEGTGRFKLLELCAKNGLDVNFIILGKLSDDTQKALDEFKAKYPNIATTTPGFVSNVQDFVMACDIVLSQSGLNAIAESFFLETPVLLSLLFYVGVPMKDFILKEKVGFCATTPEGQYECIKNLIDNPAILEEYKNNIKKLSFGYDAGEASRIIMQALTK